MTLEDNFIVCHKTVGMNRLEQNTTHARDAE